jgi:NAD(P)-dependent dehydrogenase (short-subunit alcohol dehydrogenase family)
LREVEHRRLAGKVVVVPLRWVGADALARRLAADGATVVVVGGGEDAGRLAAEIEGGGAGRVAVFSGDGSAGDADALADFVAELFRAPSPPPVPPAAGPEGGQAEEVEGDG